MNFADTIKSERKRLNMTQSEAALQLMLPFRTYWDWENGVTEPVAVTQEGVLARFRKAKVKVKQ